jgi:hypothetical protein
MKEVVAAICEEIIGIHQAFMSAGICHPDETQSQDECEASYVL